MPSHPRSPARDRLQSASPSLYISKYSISKPRAEDRKFPRCPLFHQYTREAESSQKNKGMKEYKRLQGEERAITGEREERKASRARASSTADRYGCVCYPLEVSRLAKEVKEG